MGSVMMLLGGILAVGNTALGFTLLYIHLQGFRRVRSPFTLALAMAGGLLAILGILLFSLAYLMINPGIPTDLLGDTHGLLLLLINGVDLMLVGTLVAVALR